MEIVSIDAGKNLNKYVWRGGMGRFKSKLYPYRELRGDIVDDFIVEYKGAKYFGADLGDREGYIPISYKDTSKLHHTTLINVLSALHKIGATHYKIIVGSPISNRTESEKQGICEMLKGTHKFTLNGSEKTIHIQECHVSPEGAAGFYSQPQAGIVQGLDFGSTTINYFTMEDMKFVDRKSGTFSFDTEITDLEGIMEGVHAQLSNKFGNYPTMLMGGLAREMVPIVSKYYPKAFLVQNPLFATSIGFYKIARGIYV